MEDQRVPPHDDCDGVVAHDQAVGAYEESFAVREEPDGHKQEKVDEVTQISEEVVVADQIGRAHV